MKKLLLTFLLTTSTVHAMEEFSYEKPSEKHIITQNLHTPPPYTDSGYQCKKADIPTLEAYFTELSKSVPSYRVFTIWGTGERKLLTGHKSYIGGANKTEDNTRAITWFNLTHAFLEASKKFEGKFVFEIILDERTLNDNAENIETLQKNSLIQQ